jgi:glucan biosynthesis protein C
MRLRWWSLAVALVAYIVYATYVWTHRGVTGPLELRVTMVCFYGLNQWAWVAAIFGFARRHLSNHDGPVRRYLTDAIFPYYIVHQTAIVLVAHGVVKLQLPLTFEAAVLIVATVVSCALTYEVVRRLDWLRPWFGLKPAVRPLPVSAIPPSLLPESRA